MEESYQKEIMGEQETISLNLRGSNIARVEWDRKKVFYIDSRSVLGDIDTTRTIVYKEISKTGDTALVVMATPDEHELAIGSYRGTPLGAKTPW